MIPLAPTSGEGIRILFLGLLTKDKALGRHLPPTSRNELLLSSNGRLRHETPVALPPTRNLGCVVFEWILFNRSEDDGISVLVLVLHSTMCRQSSLLVEPSMLTQAFRHEGAHANCGKQKWLDCKICIFEPIIALSSIREFFIQWGIGSLIDRLFGGLGTQSACSFLKNGRSQQHSLICRLLLRNQ